MFQLKLCIDDQKTIFQSSSQQKMIREVIDLFRSKDSTSHPLPFKGLLNRNGQIIELTIENDPMSAWWLEHHPLVFDKQVKVKGVVSKISVEEGSDGYEIPSDLYRGDGNCWAAIKDGKLVGLIYMRLEKNEDFSKFRIQAIEKLKPIGTVINGVITGKMFFPREARKLKA